MITRRTFSIQSFWEERKSILSGVLFVHTERTSGAAKGI